MIATFQFAYNNEPLTEDEIARLKEIIPTLHVEKDGKLSTWMTYTGNIEKVYGFVPHIKLTIESLLGNDLPKTLIEAVHRLEHIADKFSNRSYDNDTTYNSKVNVHVPGLGLLAINEVKVEENYCTDALQECLEDGWRIIAACPQPNQRRPDYILGRTKGE